MRTKRRLLSLALSLSLLLGLLPASVWAGEYSDEDARGILLFRLADYNSENTVQVLYSKSTAPARYGTDDSYALYSANDNTLTLHNFSHSDLGLRAYGMGTDFKIRLEGANALLRVSSDALSFGGSLHFCGDGSLTLEQGISIGARGTASVLKSDTETTLTLKGTMTEYGALQTSVMVADTTAAQSDALSLGGSYTADLAEDPDLGAEEIGLPDSYEKWRLCKDSGGTYFGYQFSTVYSGDGQGNTTSITRQYRYYSLTGTYPSFTAATQLQADIYSYVDWDSAYTRVPGAMRTWYFKSGDLPVQSLTVTGVVDENPHISTTTLPAAHVGEAYSAALAGVHVTAWSVSAGSLPAGLTLNSSTGVISGTPTAGGAYSFTVTAANDVAGTTPETREYTLAVGKNAANGMWTGRLTPASALWDETTSWHFELRPSVTLTPTDSSRLIVKVPGGILQSDSSVSVTTPGSGVTGAINADKTELTLTFDGSTPITAENGVSFTVANVRNPSGGSSVTATVRSEPWESADTGYTMTGTSCSAPLLNGNGVYVTINNYDSVKDMDLSLRLTYGNQIQATQTVYGSTVAFNVNVGSGSYAVTLLAHDALGKPHTYSAEATGTGSGGGGNSITVTPNGSDLTGYQAVTQLNGAVQQNGISAVLKIANGNGTNYLYDYGYHDGSAWVSRYWLADADLFQSGSSGATRLSASVSFDPDMSGAADYDRESPVITADKASKILTVNCPLLQTDGTLSGTVTDGSTGIPYASVIASQEINGETRTFNTVTDKGGKYSFTGLYAGKRATLTAWADGYGEKEEDIGSVASSGTTRDISLERAGYLAVVIADGQSVENPYFVLEQGGKTVRSYAPADGASFALELPASVKAGTAYTLWMRSDDTEGTNASVTFDDNRNGKVTLSPVRLGVLDWSALGGSGFNVLVKSGSYFVRHPASALRCSLPAGENGTVCTVYLSTNYEISGSPAGSSGSFTVRRGETTAVTGITPPKQEASIVGSVTGPATAAQGELYKISGVLESEIYGSDNAAFSGLRLMTNNTNALQGVTVNGTYVTVSGVATDGFVNKAGNTAVDWTFPLNFTFYLRQSDTAGTDQSAQVLAGYGEKTAVIGSVTTKAVPGITLCAPARVGARTVSVTANGAQKTVKQPDGFAFSGVAVKDRVVKLYDNETLIAIAKTDGKGRYSGTAYPAGSGYIHMLRAEQTTAEDDVISATAELAYDPSGPVLTELALYTNGSRTPLSIAGAPAAYTATGSTKYQYEATISNPGKLADMTVGNPAAAKTGDAATLTGKVFFRVHTVGGDYLLPAAQIGGENGLTWQSEEKYFGANYPTGVEVVYQAKQSAAGKVSAPLAAGADNGGETQVQVDRAYVLYNADGTPDNGDTKATDTPQTTLYQLMGYSNGIVSSDDIVTPDWNDPNDPEFHYTGDGSWTSADQTGVFAAAADSDAEQDTVYAKLLYAASNKSLSEVFSGIVSSLSSQLEGDSDVAFSTLTGNGATANGASGFMEVRTWIDQPTWTQSGVKWRIEELTGKGYKSSSASYGEYQYLYFTNTLYYDRYGKPSSLSRTVNSMGYPQTEPNPEMFKDGEMIGSSLKVEYLYSVKEGKWMRSQTAIIPPNATSPIHTAANQIPEATTPPYRYTPASALGMTVRQLDGDTVYASSVLAASNRTGGMSFKINPFKVRKETYAQGTLAVVNFGCAKILSKGDAWARANGEKGLTRFVDFNDAKYGSYALSVEETTVAGAGIGISSRISTPTAKFGDITGIREQLMANYRYYANAEKDPAHAYRSTAGKKETKELLEALSDVEYAIEMAGVQDAFTAAVTDELGFYSGVFSLFGGPLGAEGALVYDITSTLIKAANDTNNAEVKEAVDRLLARVDAYKASDSERKGAMKKFEQEKKDYNKEMGFGIYSVNEDVFNDPFSEGYQPPVTAETTPVHDPSGIIYEAVLSNPVPGATVTLYHYEDEQNPKVQWDDRGYLGQANPVTSDAAGRYSWDVPVGSWYVVAGKAGYASGNSGRDRAATVYVMVNDTQVAYLPVLPPQLNVNIPLVDYTAPTVKSIEAKNDGVYVTFSKYMDVGTLTNAFTLNGQLTEPTLLDAEQAPPNIDYGSGVAAPYYAKTVQLAGTLSGTANVTVSDTVMSYAGVKMADAYDGTDLPVTAKTQLAAPAISPASTNDATRNALVTISAEEGANVYYTTDGTAPTAESAKYTGPFPILKAMTVQAIAVKAGFTDSPIATATYRFAVRADTDESGTGTSGTGSSGTGGSGSGSSSAAVTATASGGKGTIRLNVTVSGGTARVAPLSASDVAKAVGADGGNVNVVMDLSGLGGKIETVSIPDASFDSFADALKAHDGSDSLTVKTANGSVKLNENALSAVAGAGSAGNVAFTVKNSGESGLNAAQRAAVSDKNVAGAYGLGVTANGKNVGALGGGFAEVSVPFTLEAGANELDYRVYRVEENGNTVLVPSALHDGVLTVRSDRLSDIVVVRGPAGEAFADVADTDYYADAVTWAFANGVTNGMGSGLFAPNVGCTRAQVVTFLWRAAGSPQPENGVSGFADVAADTWYGQAVAWMVENGITNGVGGDRFGVDEICTRAQVVTFLYRMNGGSGGGRSLFRDVADGQWYSDATAWAVEKGITNGMGGGTFRPDDGCTRAQIVTFLYRDFVK